MKELLASKDVNLSNNMRLEDQAMHNDGHMEEPDLLNALAQASEVTKTYSGFNNMSKLSNIKFISSGPNSQLVSPRASRDTFNN